MIVGMLADHVTSLAHVYMYMYVHLFSQVFLASVTGLPGFGEKPAEVAVKQLRCE